MQVDPRYLRTGFRAGMAIVSFAGPVSNLITAGVLRLLVRLGVIGWRATSHLAPNCYNGHLVPPPCDVSDLALSLGSSEITADYPVQFQGVYPSRGLGTDYPCCRLRTAPRIAPSFQKEENVRESRNGLFSISTDP